MSKIKVWIKSCLVLIVSVISFGVAKEAIGCYHNNAECKAVLPTCDDASVIILNDIKWHFKQNCTGECAQCCFHEPGDVNRSLSNSESVDIYTSCHRQSACDPYTNIQTPAGFENGYLHVVYTCEQETSSQADDTQTVPVHVIYAIIFPIIGLCIIVAMAFIYRRFVNKRQDAVRPKVNKDGGNEPTVNDLHASDMKPIEEAFIVSHTSTKHSKKPRKVVKFTPRELDIYNTDVPSDVNNLNGTLFSVTKAEECIGHVERRGGYRTEETVTTKEPIYDAINEIPVNDTKDRVAPNTTKRECDKLTSQPNVIPSYNVNTGTHECTASSSYKTRKFIRYKHNNSIDKRKMRRSRKKQLQLIRNMKLFWRNRQQRVSDSSSDDYLSTSSSCPESSRESNGEESEHGQTVDHNATDVVPSHSSRLKGEQQTEKLESGVIGNEIVDSGQGGLAKLNTIKKQTARKTSNETIEPESVDTFEHQLIEFNGISNDNNAVSQLPSTEVSNKQHISTKRPISNEASGNKECDIESENDNRSDKSSNMSYVPKEGPIATSSVRYAKDKIITVFHKYDDYDMAKGSTDNQNQIGNRTSISVWCIPKPPDTKSDSQYKAKQSGELLNRSMSLNEPDKRRDEVIYKRRKRKYESMRHAKRETIFEILQKLDAVPKGILKKSKSMKVSKRESDSNERQDDNRKHTRFEDDSNLTDSDKIHKLIEPEGQSVSELQTEMKQNVEKAPTFDRLPAYTTPPENLHLRKDNKPARSVVPLYGGNTEAVICESLLISNPILNGLHDVNTHPCDIISSNLRRNSNDEMDDAVKDAASISDKKACTGVMTERNQDTYSSRRQLNIRDKLIQKANSETRASVVDTLNCQSDFTNEMLTNDTQSIHGFGGAFLDSSATDNKMEAEDGVVKTLSDVHNNVRENQQLNTHLNGFGTDRNDHIEEHTDQSLGACENGADNDLRNPVTQSNPFHSLSVQKKIDDTFLSRNETNDGINGESGLENHSIETNNFSNDNYCSNYATNNASFRYSRKINDASNLPKSGSSHNDYAQNAGFERYDYSLEQHEVSGTISSPDQSDESLMHVNETDKYNEYQLPTRPKSSLGNRSRSTERYDYHQQCEEPTMQSSRTFMDTNALMKVTDTKYKLSSDKRHSTEVPTKSSLSLDIPIIQTDNASRSHSPVKVFSTNRSVEKTTKSFADTYAEQEQVLRQDGKSNVRKPIINHPVNNLMGVSRPYKETYDSAKTPNSAMKSNIETEVINESQYSKKNKKVRVNLQKQSEEFDSRHSFMKSNMATPFDLQEHTFKTIVPPRRSKTPTPGPTFDNRENQYEASIKGAAERNVENKFPPYSYSGNKSTNNIRKLSGKMDSSFEVREQARIKSQDVKNVKLLNRRLKDNTRVYDNHESKEPVRERPKSAMFGRYGSQAESRSAISRNKSMSNARDANTQSIRSGTNQSRSSNREYQRTDSRRGKQGLIAGWSRWNHRVDSATDWHLQSTSGTDVRLEEYDSEIENFFSNPDAEILQINSSAKNNRPSTGVSRSKSCKT